MTTVADTFDRSNFKVRCCSAPFQHFVQLVYISPAHSLVMRWRPSAMEAHIRYRPCKITTFQRKRALWWNSRWYVKLYF